jgi:predicted enzyme related to lactoylglutathione lyase
MVGKLTWYEIAVTDLERAKTFYEKVLGMDFEYIEMPGTKMYMQNVDHAKGEIGGALVLADDNTPASNGTIIYFNSDDCDKEASLIELAGGKLLFPKTSIGEFGNIIQFIDTEGNRIGIHSTK